MTRTKVKRLVISALTAILAITFIGGNPSSISAETSSVNTTKSMTSDQTLKVDSVALESFAIATPTPKITNKKKVTPTPKPKVKNKITPTPKPKVTKKPTPTPKPTVTKIPIPTPMSTATPTPKPTASTEGVDKSASIAKAYSDYFTIGAATSDSVLSNALTKAIVLHQFSTITMENEMKPNAMLDYVTNSSNPTKYNTSPALNLSKLDKYLKFAQDNGLKVRFHTLVWHSQTPTWFFMENYSMSSGAKLVSKEVMLQRMESYIKQIMEYTKNYPNVIYAWDVVNEAIEIGHGKPNGYRSNDSLWYQVIGEEFVEKAFTYARKYSYDDAGLFYNDYGEYDLTKRTAIYNMLKKLKDKDLIDGMGLQSHIDMGQPTLSAFEAALKVYGELGLEINITELDIHNTNNTDSALATQAARYKSLFEILLRLKKDGTANITNVTFWGVLDSGSWLTKFKGQISYPLLFDKSGQPKPAYNALINLVSK